MSVSHINGGPTAISIAEAEKLIRKTSLALEIVHCGNSKMILDVMKIAKEVKALSRSSLEMMPFRNGRHSSRNSQGD